MKWDRKLLIIGIAAVVFLLAAMGVVAIVTFRGIESSADRIEGRAAEGFESLSERLGSAENISDMYTISKRGHYADRTKYGDFDVSVLQGMEYAGGEYLEEGLEYTYVLEFHLRAYDKENVYDENDSISAYTKFTDSFTMLKNGTKYYVSYMNGGEEYRFVVECAELTEWLTEWGG